VVEPPKAARPATVEDLKRLLNALNSHGVDYLLIGGYALYALGYQRGTVDIAEGETIRVADEFVVDLMFNAAGETYESLQPHAVTIDFEGVPVRTLDIEGLLKTKQTVRDKDRLDREVLERALGEIRRSRTEDQKP
jgi:hypothetical protein